MIRVDEIEEKGVTIGYKIILDKPITGNTRFTAKRNIEAAAEAVARNLPLVTIIEYWEDA
jgi:hypothetical protein